MKLPEYLESIRLQLTMQPKQVEQIITEIRQHITDQTRRHLLNGISINEAEQLACEEFGKPAAVALRFNQTHRHLLHSFWRIMTVVLVVYTTIRFFIALNFVLFMDSYRGFSLTIGPGFYDSQFTIYSCLGFGLLAVFMARFIYRYLAPLNISQQAQQLSLLLATITVAFYHLILSTIQYLVGIVGFNQLIEGVNNYGDPIYIANMQLPIDRAVYYICINLLYSGLTTLVLLVSMQVAFWFLQRRDRSLSYR